MENSIHFSSINAILIINVCAEAHGGHLVMRCVKQENQLKFVTKM